MHADGVDVLQVVDGELLGLENVHDDEVVVGKLAA
jgi:hypothetical protein